MTRSASGNGKHEQRPERRNTNRRSGRTRIRTHAEHRGKRGPPAPRPFLLLIRIVERPLAPRLALSFAWKPRTCPRCALPVPLLLRVWFWFGANPASAGAGCACGSSRRARVWFSCPRGGRCRGMLVVSGMAMLGQCILVGACSRLHGGARSFLSLLPASWWRLASWRRSTGSRPASGVLGECGSGADGLSCSCCCCGRDEPPPLVPLFSLLRVGLSYASLVACVCHFAG